MNPSRKIVELGPVSGVSMVLAMDPKVTYKLLIEYDGTNLHGWQIQEEHTSVQSLLEDALEIILKLRPGIVGSGRTDAGVHARGQVAHFCLPAAVDHRKLQASLNGLLPRSVRILALEEATPDFHARYDAVLRTYHYYISTQPRSLDSHVRWHVRPAPDVDAMNQGAVALVGKKDFSSFCRAKSDTVNRVCQIDEARWVSEARSGDWYFRVRGNRFLHGMVRAMVGTLLEVGHGRHAAGDVAGIVEARDRRAAGQAAPAKGLVLEEVTYPGERGFNL